MRHSIKTGVSFGLTSGIITTLGLIIGLHASTYSQLVVIGGVFTIAIADAFSDALGIHMSEESEGKHSFKEIWESTVSTFLTKFVVSLSFLIPIIFLPLMDAIIVSIIWGFSLIVLFSLGMAMQSNSSKLRVIFEHVVIASLVIIIAHYAGVWINTVF